MQKAGSVHHVAIDTASRSTPCRLRRVHRPCINVPIAFRCLETATIGLEGFGIPYVACQHFQECADLPCDTGVPVPELAPRFPDVDFSELPDEWYSKCGHYNFLTHYQSAEGLRLLNQRMEAATEYLCSRPEDSIVVSAHHTVYCFLVGIEFANCEVMCRHCPSGFTV